VDHQPPPDAHDVDAWLLDELEALGTKPGSPYRVTAQLQDPRLEPLVNLCRFARFENALTSAARASGYEIHRYLSREPTARMFFPLFQRAPTRLVDFVKACEKLFTEDRLTPQRAASLLDEYAP
jgi:hypothetical protein